MLPFAPATRAWFETTFSVPTPVQVRGWDAIAAGHNALLIAPTGSGKTLAAFLWCIDRLAHAPAPEPGSRVVYVSPLKALVYDVERNLRAPLVGIARAAERLGDTAPLPRVAVRTGDTTARERRAQLKQPAEILVTTPESLYLLLGSQAREHLRGVDTVIVDEVHALAPTKRGAHLALSLERLSALCEREPQRIGLSATARPLDAVARYLGGDRAVTVVDTSERPAIDLAIVVPVSDMTRPDDNGRPPVESPPRQDPARGPETHPAGDDDTEQADAKGASLPVPEGGAGSSGGAEQGLWPAIYPRLIDLIRAHTTSIVFVNSRGLCERLTQRLNDLAGEELVRSHHGSLAHAERRVIEEQLKTGGLRAIVATSSLELGIDMGAVDLVVLVESPGSVARGLQRVGRAGHGVGQVSKGRLFPKHRGDLLEAAVVVERMGEGALEGIRVPRNPLDVLAQQIVAMVATEEWPVRPLYERLRRAASFQELPEEAYHGVLDMLSGRYPSSAFADLRPRLVWDREHDRLTARRGTKMLALVNGGTIPDRGTYGVHLGEDGARVGELDEEMVHETVPGNVFTLGASSWRVERITRDRVIVSPAPGEPGKLPFWRGDGPGRPIELGRAIGAFLRELTAKLDDPAADAEAEATAWLRERYRLDAFAADNLIAYVSEQRQVAGAVPTDRVITIERFRDELGDFRVCILSPFGARVHAPWALALEARLSARTGFEIQTLWSDDGIVLRFGDGDALPDMDALVPEPEELDELLLAQLGGSALFAGQFRENAARSLLMPRRRPGQRTPLWVQRLKSQELLAAARQYPSFPVIIETYRSCLQDVFDVPALTELLAAIRSRQIRVHAVETAQPSPFSRSLVFAYVAAYLYEGDTPLAERKAQALSLDRRLLRELLGEEQLRELLDADVIAQLELELQRLVDERKARHADAVHDLLRWLGDLTTAEVASRVARDAEADAEALLGEVARARRAIELRVGGEPRWIAVEDAALYRDALGAAPPSGVPAVFLQGHDAPLETLLARYARTHGPFRTGAVASRYALPPAQLEPVLRAMAREDRLLEGAFHPSGAGSEWCDSEVMRRIKRRTLAVLRDQVAPVDAETLARFLPMWHGIGQGGRGLSRLQETLVQLEGLPLSYAELEGVILPARVADFSPRMLDELGALGWLVWVGHGALGARDGKVALYRRERVASLLDEPQRPDSLEPIHVAILAHLEQRGASFWSALKAASGAPAEEVLAALWDLVWAGLVTNDTFQPLRHAGPVRGGNARARASFIAKAAGGRWSPVRELLHDKPSPTECAHAAAVKLLERHGVVSREVGGLELLPGGFSAVYRVLREMEAAGKVRRGYFVEGLGGAQFAFPGAIDRLRAVREGAGSGALVLAATDPANPFGWLLPWPVRGDAEGNGPRRVAGAAVVSVRGVPVVYVSANGKHLLSFPAADDRATLIEAARALDAVAARKRGKALRLETIDGQRATASELAEALEAAEFRRTYSGLERELR